MRAYDSLIGHVKELSEAATRLSGPAGETLLEECTAQACPCLAISSIPEMLSRSRSGFLLHNPHS